MSNLKKATSLDTDGSNNYPLRGGKFGNCEGGVRVNGLVGGGALPAAQRGTKTSAFVAVEDFYTTFCAIAGVDPRDDRAAAAGLPPVDGVNQWPHIAGTATASLRDEVVIGTNDGNLTVVQGLINATSGWKLLLGSVYPSWYQSPQYPNASSTEQPTLECGATGCLFNVLTDPTEQNDVASQHPAEVAALGARIAALQAGVYNPFRGGGDAGRPANERICEAGLTLHGGFVGPFLP